MGRLGLKVTIKSSTNFLYIVCGVEFCIIGSLEYYVSALFGLGYLRGGLYGGFLGGNLWIVTIHQC